jgi:hypothetical protein
MGASRLRGRPVPLAPPSTLTLTGAPATAATVGLNYGAVVWPVGGVEPYTFSLSGTLPAGLSFDTKTGGIYGTPITAQIRTGLNVTVTDSASATASLSSFQIAVTAVAWNDVPTDPTSFFANMAAANPGDRLVLDIGNYGIDTNGKSKAVPGIQILGQAGVNFSYINLDTCAGFWMKNINVTGASSSDIAVNSISGDRNIFDGLTIHLSGASTAVKVRLSTNGVVQNCDIADVGDGINGASCTNYLISQNTITRFGSNGMQHQGMTDLIIERNSMSNVAVAIVGAHYDALQLASDGTTRGLRVSLRWNRWERLTGSAEVQGIGFMEFQDYVQINGNSSFGCDSNACMDSACTNVSKRNNFMQSWPDQGNANMFTRDGSDKIIMAYNQANAVYSYPSPPDPDPTNVSIFSNTIIPQATGSADTALRNTFLAANPLIP